MMVGRPATLMLLLGLSTAVDQKRAALLVLTWSLLGCSDIPNQVQDDGADAPRPVGVACLNSVNDTVLSLLDWELGVVAEPIRRGQTFGAALSGVAGFDAIFLDGAQLAIPGGVREVNFVELNATVQARTGATGEDVTLHPDIAYQCASDKRACDPDNDLPGTAGLVGNTDCQPEGALNPCGRFVLLPTSTNCAPGGVCEGLAKTGPSSQCERNGFCITGNLKILLAESTGLYEADVDGEVVFGWDDRETGATVQAEGPNAGTWILPPAVYDEPAGPLGIRITVRGIPVAVECTMGVDSKGPLGVDSVDFLASPTPSAALIRLPIVDLP